MIKIESFATGKMSRKELMLVLYNTGQENVNFIVPLCVFPGKLTNCSFLGSSSGVSLQLDLVGPLHVVSGYSKLSK
jgi:hypothetical protein